VAKKQPQVSIIGIGLLGGSLARVLKKRGGFRLIGWSPSASTRTKAKRLLKIYPRWEDAVRDADVVVLGSPSGVVVPLLRQILPFLKSDALVMDMASVKGRVARDARSIPGVSRHFVPCHPMAGKEKSGVDYSDESLYVGRKIFLTPYADTPKPLLKRAVAFWKKTGGQPILLRASDHDRRVAITSHLPQLMACALMENYGEALKHDARLKEAVGTGLKDTTRIAASSPAMWVDILELNAVELKTQLSRMRCRLARMESNLKSGRRAYWNRFFSKARAWRKGL